MCDVQKWNQNIKENKDNKKETTEEFEYIGIYKNTFQGSIYGKKDKTCHTHRQKQWLLDTK